MRYPNELETVVIATIFNLGPSQSVTIMMIRSGQCHLTLGRLAAAQDCLYQSPFADRQGPNLTFCYGVFCASDSTKIYTGSGFNKSIGLNVLNRQVVGDLRCPGSTPLLVLTASPPEELCPSRPLELYV